MTNKKHQKILKLLTTSVMSVLVLTISIVSINPNSYAETPESLLSQFEVLANENLRLQDNFNKKTNELNDAKSNDLLRVSVLDLELSEIATKLDQNGRALDEIRTLTSKFYEIDPQLKVTLSTAQNILHDNHDTIPWNGVGIDYRNKALMVQFESNELAEKYIPDVKQIIGKDIPINVIVGQNFFEAGCSSRYVDCNPLIGGLQIDDDSSGSPIECTLGYPVVRTVSGVSKNGFLTAGHCYATSTYVKQPYGSASANIGFVSARDFVNNGDCDCEFIEQTSSDSRPNEVYAGANSVYSLTSKTDASVGQYVVVSGAGSNIIDWGIVEAVNYTYTGTAPDGSQVTIYGTTRVSSWSTQAGDSGSPVFDPTYNVKKFYGTFMGRIETGSYTDQRVYMPWSAIASNLYVS